MYYTYLHKILWNVFDDTKPKRSYKKLIYKFLLKGWELFTIQYHIVRAHEVQPIEGPHLILIMYSSLEMV